jgi:predicted oxidoreductase
VDGVQGVRLAPDAARRGAPSNREVLGDFAFGAQVVVVTSGGIGGNHDLVRAAWPASLGTPPSDLLTGVPAHVDGRMLGVARTAGANVVNGDRMWHYTEGVANHDPIWPGHGIRILPGPSSLWLDALGRRLPAPLFPGFDTLGTLAHIARSGQGHTWFLTTMRILEKEFALSGSEQNPDLTGRSVRQVLGRARSGVAAPVRAFLERGEDFVVRDTLPELVAGMNALTPHAPLVPAEVERLVVARDREVLNPFTKDLQIAALRGARRYRGDRLIRVAPPHRLLDPSAGPLVAVRLRVLTRKTLGGLETDLSARVLRRDGSPLPGLFAAGEVAGFGGGGMHGYASLEGTFLGGCLFSGRTAGRAAAVAAA